MKKDIYIIKNTINDKVYIGQSIDANKRFIQHKNRSKINSDNSILYAAMNKYGTENFYMEILENQIENYNEQEIYWISKYNSLYPNGYNILSGGDTPPYYNGEDHWNSTISQVIANQIIDELMNSNNTLTNIAKKYEISYSIIRHINYGEAWRKNGINYPIKQIDERNTTIDETTFDNIAYLLKNSTCSMEQIGEYFNLTRKVVARINQGRSNFHQQVNYPIRKNRKISNESVENALLKGGRI